MVAPINKIRTVDTSTLVEQNDKIVPDQNLVNEIDAALKEMDDWLNEYGSQTDADGNPIFDLDKLEYLKATLKAERAAIMSYGKGGGGGADGTTATATWTPPQDLAPGWNGIDADRDVYDEPPTEDVGEYEAYGEYQGTIKPTMSDDPANPNYIGFQAEEGAISITAYTKGKDLIIVEEFPGNVKKYWIVKGDTLRDMPLVISTLGTNCNNIDLSGVYRAGKTYITGNDNKNDIKGAQSGSYIQGMGGNDTITGGIGIDVIYGDEYYAAGTKPKVDGGNDTIDGLGGDDIIYGGAGYDSYVKYDGTTGNAEESIAAEKVVISNLNTDGGISSSDNSWGINNEESINKNEIIIENKSATGEGGELTIDLGALGIDKAFAKQEGNDLVITGINTEGKVVKITVKGFFAKQFGDEAGTPASKIVTLNIKGGSDGEIIDFSAVEVSSQIININGGQGEDIIIGATNALLKSGVDLENIKESSVSSGELVGVKNEGVFTEATTGYDAEVTDGAIVITKTSDEATIPCVVKVPDGYTEGYIGQDENGMAYVVLVKADGSGDTIVYKFDTNTIDPNEIQFCPVTTKEIENGNGTTEETTATPLTLIAISLDPNDYTVTGGTGDDVVMADKGSNTGGDSDEEVIEKDVSKFKD